MVTPKRFEIINKNINVLEEICFTHSERGVHVDRFSVGEPWSVEPENKLRHEMKKKKVLERTVDMTLTLTFVTKNDV